MHIFNAIHTSDSHFFLMDEPNFFTMYFIRISLECNFAGIINNIERLYTVMHIKLSVLINMMM